ncbi:zn 2cys6 cluster transcripitional activator [Grosmannia clavigera kw1407]|uniref:Zn 2cys6 cluster transcripitional activator n=1 Tax=Grosmannia clavigera (strain kw1407 / UAMH 11150) TaxID=655863 RepID=F0XPB6_GROCL|nr:zn 2cys6 cluster transcripitional activator [Grosmannia clavigera kw1407]EFX00506.1 zn 2cys6 cluster transcripitional activator [Grosmannia clavigera kw1407]
MPRSSFSDNPLLRVSRPVSACSRCRAAKVKCDGKLPACTACEKAGRESDCSAANDQFARGKERSYVAALELRVEKLERRLTFARSRTASVAQIESDSSLMTHYGNDRKDSLAFIRAAIHRKALRKRQLSDVNSLVSDFGYLSVNATTRDFEPSVSNMTFARLVLATTVNDPLPEAPQMSSRIPLRQTAIELVQHYLGHIHILLPFFAETTILAHLEELYHQHHTGAAQPPQLRPNLRDADYWLFYMVLAISSAFQSCSCQDSFYANGVDFAAQAMRYADGALAPGRSTQVQSLLLLTMYSMLDPAHFDSWHLIGITCRAIVDLGFHQDPPRSQNMDATTLDARRCTFYCAYALDRTISMVNARAFSFTDDGINVAFPSMIGRNYPRPRPHLNPSGPGPRLPAQSVALNHMPLSPSSLGPPTSPALLIFQLRRAQSHWYQMLYQSDPKEPLADPTAFVWRMCADMREWAEALPVGLPANLRDSLDLELQYSYVYCIAPSTRAPLVTTVAWRTYHDALRVFFMGSQFVAVLRDASAADAILAGGGSVPVPLALPGEAPPPPMPKAGMRNQGLGGGGRNGGIYPPGRYG